MNLEHEQSDRRLWWATGAASLVVAAVAVYSTKLRPIADDYCFGSKASQGYLSALANYYRSSSGDLLVIFTNTTLVGVPVAQFPWWLASAFTFWLGVVAVVAAAVASFRPHAGGLLTSARSWIALAPIVAVAWLAYWWVPAMFGVGGRLARFEHRAIGITMWQNLNAAYVIPLALVLVVYCSFIIRTEPSSLSRRVGLVVAGLIAGVSGPVLAVSIIAWSFCMAGLGWYREGRRSTTSLRWQLLLLGTCVGYFSTTLSPGFSNRVEGTGVRGISYLFDLRIIFRVILAGGAADLVLLLVAGPVLVFVAAWAAGRIFSTRWSGFDHAALRRFGIGLALFGVLMVFVNRTSEALVYPAFWHQVPIGLAFFVASAALGVGAADIEVARAGRPLRYLPAPALAVASLAAVVSIGVMASEIDRREERWAVEAAPREKMVDIETRWVGRCWIQLTDLRDTPDRAGGWTPTPSE